MRKIALFHRCRCSLVANEMDANTAFKSLHDSFCTNVVTDEVGSGNLAVFDVEVLMKLASRKDACSSSCPIKLD